MSGLFGSLQQSVQSLNAQSRGVETAGRNLANVNNASYARQRVVFGERGTVITPQGVQSLGIEAKSIQQLRDSLLDRQLVREIGLTAALTASENANGKSQAALGENIDRTQAADGTSASTANGLGAALGAFFNGFQAVAARPTDLGERQTLLQQADSLAQRFRLTDSRLAQVQSDLGSEVSTDTASINDLLSTIATLNAQIGRSEINAAGSAGDLRDQRQASLEKLAAKMAIETRPNATEAGQVDVFVRDGAGAAIDLVTLGVVTNPVAYDGTQLTAGTAATPIALGGGSVKGLLATRDGTVQTLRDELEALATQFATSVNTAYNPTGATGNFFQFTAGSAAGTLALAGGLTAAGLKASDNPAAPGDNTLALAVSALSTRVFSTTGGDQIDGTFAQYYSGVVSGFGRDVAGVSANLDDQTRIETLVRQQRDSYSGVSMDEELTDLTKYQRAFQASSRVISIIDDLLDTVINRMG